jgi:hypothetical protein
LNHLFIDFDRKAVMVYEIVKVIGC